MDIDTFQEEIGGISSYQAAVLLLTTYVAFASGFHTISVTFISAVPEHRCAVPPIDDSNYYNLTENEIKNYTIPYSNAEGKYDSCHRYAYNLSNCEGGNDFDCITFEEDIGVIPCDKGYFYDSSVYVETSVSQWNLVCERQYLDTIASTLFFLGFFVGSLFIGPFSDWFGRKISLFVVTTGLLVTGIGCAFSPSYEVFVITRIFVGGFSIISYICTYIYVSEISTKRWRTEVAAFASLCSAVAHSVFPGFAYIFRDWHELQFFTTLFVIPCYAIFIFIPESPRWLMSRGRFDDAKRIIQRYAKSKNAELKDEIWEKIMETAKAKNAEEEMKKKLKVWDLYRRPVMRIISINVLYSWFCVSMIFYGLSLNGGNLAGDPYLNNALNGIVEIGGNLFVYFSGPLGRKSLLSGTFIFSGIACISSMLFDLNANGDSGLTMASTVLAIAGKFFATTTFAVIYLVTAEIYPTEIRSTAISMGSMAARVGSMMSPLILQIQSSIPWFMQTVFGILSIIAGLTSLFYPETTKSNYMRSLDEAEEFYWENIAVLKWIRRRKQSQKDLIEENSFTFEDDNNVQATKL